MKNKIYFLFTIMPVLAAGGFCGAEAAEYTIVDTGQEKCYNNKRVI